MFDRVLKFFLDNYKVNYALFFLIFAIGIYSYTKIPKEVSPTIEPDSITIRGSYSGASIDTLNKIAVEQIEKEIKSIDGIKSITSVLSSGRFSIIAELSNNVPKQQITKNIEDAIKLVTPNLPKDMDEPTIRTVAHSRSLMHISILSNKVSRAKLIQLANSLKDKLLHIKDISSVSIFGDSSQVYEILIDEQKLRVYDQTLNSIINLISELSYIFPIGKIDDSNNQVYISTNSGKKLAVNLGDTVLNLGEQTIYLKDIATITKKYESSKTLASMNGKNSITLAISQNSKGDAIQLSKDVKELLSKSNIKDVTLDIRLDQSKVVKNSLNVVISNILFGIILIVLLISILINIRLAFVIALGIPTSFIIGAIYFYISGYTINVNSLIGVLIAIGIIVDDAIVVSENIQQYIQKGYSSKEAAYLGTKEMAKPVTIASLTTLFSFIPLLMISGRLGEIIQLIPIALSALVLASLLESFIFLPIHSVHILNKNSKVLSWDRVNKIYYKILSSISNYKKSFLLLFFIVVPSLIYFYSVNSRFQMFKSFDSNYINITFQATQTTTLEESLKIIQTIENDLLKQKEKFFIKNVSSTAGYRRTATGTTQMYPYVGYISVELYEKKPSNFVDKYITPYLSWYYDRSESNKIRTESSKVISKQLRKFIREKRYKKNLNLVSINVVERRMGHTKADIRIAVISDQYKKALEAIDIIQNKLKSINGVKYVGNNILFGNQEIKLHINSYGAKLGITERYIGSHLSNLYLDKTIGKIFEKKDLIDIKIKSANKDDFTYFNNMQIPLKDGTYVMIKDICNIEKTNSLERLVKEDGITSFFVFANVDQSVATDAQVLKKLQPTIEKLKKSGIRFRFKGEAAQKKTLKTEMILASVLAIVLIFISMLYLFNSIRDSLIVMSVIPFSFLGIFIGHDIMNLNISLPSLIGGLGLSGVIVNDGIIMLNTIKDATKLNDVYELASRRLRPIVLTSITTIVGLSSLMFFASGQSASFQPLAISIGFGLMWGTILNLIYLPIMYIFIRKNL